MPHHGVSAGCKADPECFRVSSGALVRQSAKAALDAETDVERVKETAKGAVKVAAKVATADRPWSRPDGPRLYQCMA